MPPEMHCYQDNVVAFITKSVQAELREIYPGVLPEEEISLSESLSRIKNIVGQKFIIIIDEWDVLIRDEAANKKVQEKYINFLRAMFKGTEPTNLSHLQAEHQGKSLSIQPVRIS